MKGYYGIPSLIFMSPKKSKNKKPRTTRYHQQPRKGKKVLRWVSGIIVLTILFIFLSGNRSLIKLYSLYQEKNKLKMQKEKLLEQQKNLEEEIEKLKTDKDYMEKVAREKYNMKKEDEEVYIIESK